MIDSGIILLRSVVLEIEGLNYIWSITCPTCPCDMFDMFLWYVPLVCSTCSFDMFSMFLQYVQHAHNTCSSCKNYMYLHVLPHVPCSMCMFFSGGPNFEGYENNHIPSWGISPWDAVAEDCLHMDNRSMASVFPFTRFTDIYNRPTF